MKEIKLQGQDLGGAVLGGNGNDKGGDRGGNGLLSLSLLHSCNPLTKRFVLSLLQEASGWGAGRPERCAGRAGGEGEGDGRHQPSSDTQELHCPECNRGCRKWRLLRGQDGSTVIYSHQ